ncbi:hypothetical protein [Pseudolysinimonas sp.]|uniref:hypothetical protein n=1 Tax=Pseudolysinimonas sp. TaxID=2680009 RepID=UPI00286A4363|nr:hypothetical protein [Pseudolysinimonas sp.]
MATARRGSTRGGVFSPRSRTSDVVADAVLLATGAVRSTVKNLLIVRALRDRADFDEPWWHSAVAREFELLAVENEADATRLEGVRTAAKKKQGRALHPADFRARDAPVLKRRMRILRKIATRLRELATDEDAVRALVEEARQNALHEITTARHDPSPRAARDPEERAAGLALLADDLAALAASAADPVSPPSAEPS